MHLTISLVRRKIFQVQNHLCKSRQFTVRSGHGRLVVRGACGLVEGIIIRRRAMPENGHSWWPEQMRRSCDSQKLNPGRNLRVRCHQARQQVRRKRRKCTLNLSIQHVVPNAEPTIDSEMPDGDATIRTRISSKRPDPGELKEEVPKRLRIVTKQSRPLWMATDTMSEQPEKRARIPETHAEVDPETFALTLESRGNHGHVH